MILLTKLFDLRSLSIVLFALILSIDCFAQGPLTVNPTADPSQICMGETAQLHTNASGGSGDYSYNWTSNPPGFSSDLPDPVVSPNVTTTYTIMVDDGFGMASGSVTVTVYDNPVPDAGNDQTIPFGTSAILQGSAGSGSGNYIFSWQPADKLINPDVAQPMTVNLYQSTLFTLSVTDAVTGCIAEQPDDVVVTITGSPLSVNPTATPQESCAGQTVQLFAIAGGGSGTYAYSWTSVPPGYTSTETNPIVTPQETTTFTVVVNDGFNIAQGSVTVTIYDNPAAYAGENQAIPYNSSTQLFGQGDGSVVSYHWEPQDLLVNAGAQNPITLPLVNTTTFILEVENIDGCTDQDEVTVQVGETVPLNLLLSASENTVCKNQGVNLYASVTGGTGIYNYTWTSNPAGFTSTLQNPVAYPGQPTWYYLVVTDGDQVITDSIQINLFPDPEIFNLSGDGFICQGGEGIEIHLNGSETGCNYELFRNSASTGVIITGTGFTLSFGLQGVEGSYMVVATNSNTGCSTEMESTAFISYFVYGQADEICMVSVDSVSGRNIITWEKTPDEAIASYKIYRESTSGGSFELMGNIDHENTGIYTDNASNPLQRSFSYGLTTLDTCNNESSMSEVHTTIHLNINSGINSYNLIWTPYYGLGYQTYYIHRRHAADGFHILDSVPNSILSYSDLNPPGGVLDYIIEIRNNNGCNDLRENESYASVFSNIISTNVGIEDLDGDSGFITIIPNPNHGQFTLKVNQKVSSISIFDLTGNLIDSYNELINPPWEKHIDLSHCNSGMYLIKATLENGLVVNRFVLVY